MSSGEPLVLSITAHNLKVVLLALLQMSQHTLLTRGQYSLEYQELELLIADITNGLKELNHLPK